MTEYEMIAAGQGYVANGMTILLNSFTVLGAYLVAGYVAAHRISFLMALFVTGLFVAFSATSMIMFVNLGALVQALFDH